MALELLIVDDDPMIRRMVTHTLRAAGFDVLEASDGVEALEVIRDHAPQLVVTDWMMPRLDGLELCRAMRERAEVIGHLYVVVLTAMDETARIVEAFEAGADDYLCKPFNRHELVARVRAGARLVELKNELARREIEIHRRNAELEVAYQNLAVANRRLDEMAATDELTKLGNRRAAMGILERRWQEIDRHGGDLACVLLDIDRFKSINDTHGHDVGDLVLQRIAATLDEHTRASERIHRFGGEEFLLVCPRATVGEAAVAAERLRVQVAGTRIETRDGELGVTVSLGVAERTIETPTVAALLKAADEALYRAKREGRNRVCVAGDAAGHEVRRSA